MAVHLSEVVEDQEILVVPVVLLENSSDLLLSLVPVGLGVHRLHELNEADTSSLLGIKLCSDLIGSLPVGIEAVLREEKLEIVGQ